MKIIEIYNLEQKIFISSFKCNSISYFLFYLFFCSRGVLQIIGNIKKNEIKTIYSNQIKSEKYKPNNINKILNDNLYYLNKNIQPDKVNYIILTDVLQPLSEYITENKDIEIFSMSQDKFKEIIDMLIEKMNHNYYLELFFNIENSLE